MVWLSAAHYAHLENFYHETKKKLSQTHTYADRVRIAHIKQKAGISSGNRVRGQSTISLSRQREYLIENIHVSRNIIELIECVCAFSA